MAIAGRLAAIAAIVGGLAGAFAYAGGWLTPRAVTPAATVDALERAGGGPHAGFRRNHAKGVCFRGNFDANGRGVRLSRAAVFAAGRTPVIGRFALAGPRPFVADDVRAVRSLAIEFDLSTGEEWRMGINGLPVFPVRTPEGFYDMPIAGAPDPRTGRPDPARMVAFRAKHSESIPALQQVMGRPLSTGFADETYNSHSLNAFHFVAADGTVTPVRWAMVPAPPVAQGPAGEPARHFRDDESGRSTAAR